MRKVNNGGYNDGDPPLTIPNREVKPISADDTAIPSGKVGSRQLCETFRRNSEGLFFMLPNGRFCIWRAFRGQELISCS